MCAAVEIVKIISQFVRKKLVYVAMSYKGLEDDFVVLNHQQKADFQICQMQLFNFRLCHQSHNQKRLHCGPW